jgi:endoglucanase
MSFERRWIISHGALLGVYCLLALSGRCLDASEPARDIFEANRALGRGVNLGNYLEVPRSEDWSVKLELKHLSVIKQAGFDSIRLPVKWSDYAASSAPYEIDANFFARVDRWLEEAERVQLNVVLNVHHYYDLDKQPREHTPRFVAIWKQIASRYRDRGEWLYFELHNEPHEALDQVWNEVLVAGLKAVRESNPTRPVIIGPPSWNGIWVLGKLALPDDPNVIVTVHMYNPHEFTHQGASWAEERVRNLKNLSWGSPAEVQAVRDEIGRAAAWGKAHQRPIYLGEFGAYEKAPQDSRIRWTRVVAREAEEQGLSWAYWEFGAGFGVYSLEQQRWRPDLLQALLPQSPALSTQ